MFESDDEDVLAIETLLRLFKGIQEPGEQIAVTEYGDGVAVSTIYANDLETFETAVCGQDEHWHPVERYETREEALEGHDKWVDLAKDAHHVTELGFGPLLEPELKKIRG